MMPFSSAHDITPIRSAAAFSTVPQDPMVGCIQEPQRGNPLMVLAFDRDEAALSTRSR